MDGGGVMRAATCFSGIGAPEVAMPHWNWLWHAEIEKFPSAVMAARHSGSVNLGDVTADDFMQRASAYGQLDVLAGGPPCQAFSVAGLRKSMDDDRGNLSLRFVKIAHAIRPRNLLVENVPGWLNTPDNAFGCFLGAILGHDDALHSPRDGKWPSVGMAAGPLGRLCWATLDAQFFGLAQRRKRVFVVVDFGGGADPVSVLFEPESLCRNPPSRGKAGQGVADNFEAGVGGGDRVTEINSNDRIMATIDASMDRKWGSSQWVDSAQYVFTSDGQANAAFSDDLALTLNSTHEQPYIAGVFGVDYENNATLETQPIGPLMAGSKSGGGRPLPAVAYLTRETSPTIIQNYGKQVDSSDTSEGPNVIAVAFSENQQANISENDVVSALNRGGGKPGQSYPAVRVGLGDVWAVRRLTPTECERLQGFPDGFTDVQYRGKGAADGPRYKALGNSWAKPVGRWILDRIERFMPHD